MKNKFMELFEKCSDELKDLAFTHSSFAHDKGIQSNERIEFLGDSVLQTIVSSYLYKNYHEQEGKMTKIRSKFVCEDSLCALAKELKIEGRIKFGKSYKQTNVSNAILADTIECMIGAMYLTYGLPSIATAVIDALQIKENMQKGIRATDYKSELQEYTQNNKQKLKYETSIYETKGGQENFRAACFVNGEFVAYGQGSTKREAEQNAAKLTLKKIKLN